MARKPNRMYRQIKGQSYTRHEYTGGIPAPRITQFHMGNKDGNFPVKYTIKAKETCQVRHTALEAARIVSNKYIQKVAGAANYRLAILVYPHQILRENKQATGAGADRVSMGMRKAFGKNIGTAARVKIGQSLMTISVPPQFETQAKVALRKASQKLPTPVWLVKDQ